MKKKTKKNKRKINKKPKSKVKPKVKPPEGDKAPSFEDTGGWDSVVGPVG